MDRDNHEIEKLDGLNYMFWRVRIEDILYLRDLDLPISGEKPEDMKQHEWDILDRKALKVVRSTIAPSMLSNITKEKTTVDLFNTLERLHQKSLIVNKVYLIKKLFNMKMSENDVVAEYLNEFNTVCYQLDSIGMNLDDEIKAHVLLSSLPDSWSTLVVCVTYSSGSTKIKHNDVATMILEEEVRRKMEGVHLSLDMDNRGRSSTKCKRWENKMRSKSRNRSKSRGRYFKSDNCFNCGKIGHWKRDCKVSPNCFNCGKAGHWKRNCKVPPK